MVERLMVYIQDSEQGELFVVDETIQSIKERLALEYDYDPTDDHLLGGTL